jgi:hypothetical protein
MAHSILIKLITHKTDFHLVEDPHFYRNKNIPKLVQPHNPNIAYTKEIYSARLGISYTIKIKKYKDYDGHSKYPHLKNIVHNPNDTHNQKTCHLYYKEYSKLQFDVVRYEQQETC